MTIAISGNFTEGVVLGADSAASYTKTLSCSKPTRCAPCTHTTPVVSQVYNGAQKIYHLGTDELNSPFAVMIYGAASFSNIPWRNVCARFSYKYPLIAFKTAQDAVNAFMEFLKEVTPDAKDRPRAGVFFCGAGPEDLFVQSFRIDVLELKVEIVNVGMVAWGGMPSVVQREVLGISAETIDAFNGVFGNLTVDRTASDGKKEAVKIADIAHDIVRQTSPKVDLDRDMPLRDGIDYVHFLVYSTVKHYKFAHLAAVCGGEVELAVITKDRGFRRVKRKSLDSELFN